MQHFHILPPSGLCAGCLRITHDQRAIHEIDFVTHRGCGDEPRNDFERRLLATFQHYFSHPRQRLQLPLQLRGTPFQRRVWQALQELSPGEVITYGELATRLHSSARAVGNACRRNPIPIVVPCHRVVARGGIGGFAGATEGAHIEQKRALLAHEGVMF